MASFPLPDIKCGSSLLQWELCESTPAPYLGPPFLKIYFLTSYFPDSIVCEESTHNNLGPHDYFIRPVDFVHLRQVDPDFVGFCGTEGVRTNLIFLAKKRVFNFRMVKSFLRITIFSRILRDPPSMMIALAKFLAFILRWHRGPSISV